MKNNMQKSLALLMTLGMLLLILPGAVLFAEPDPICQIIDIDGESVVQEYEHLSEALAAAEDGQTIKLLENINYSGGIVVKGRKITFDVNGKILNVFAINGHALEVGPGGEVRLIGRAGGGKFNVYGNGNGAKHGVYVYGGGIAEVTDASTAGSGWDARGAYATGAGTELIMYGSVTWSTINGIAYAGFYGLDASAGATVTIYGNVTGGGAMLAYGEGTKVTIYGYTNGGGTGVFAYDSAEVYVKGNVYGGGAGVYLFNGAKVTVDGYIRAYTGGQVYAQFGSYGPYKMQKDFEPVSSKDGYFEYNDGISYVWVKYFDPPLKGTVTYEPGERGTFSAITYSEVVYGLATPAPPEAAGEEGWLFAGWSPEWSSIMTGDAVYTALWQEAPPPPAPTFTVSYEPGDYGAFEIVIYTEVEYGADTPEAPDALGIDGWEFDGWAPMWSTHVIDDVVYIAQWSEIAHEPDVETFVVSYEPGAYGMFDSVTHAELEYGAFTPEAPELPALEGWRFIGWEPTWSPFVTENTVYVALWEEILAEPAPTFTVEYDPGEHGLFPTEIYPGLEDGADTPAAPDTPGLDGWEFAGWEPEWSPVVTGNVKYVAQWTEETEELTDSGNLSKIVEDSDMLTGDTLNPPPAINSPSASPVVDADAPKLSHDEFIELRNELGINRLYIPEDHITYVEYADDGTPLGEWHWDEETHMWIFDKYPPIGNLPMTGARGYNMEALAILYVLALGAHIIQSRVAKAGKHAR